MNLVKTTFSILFIFLFNQGIGQVSYSSGIDRFQVDTLIHFKAGINHYDFVIDGPSQGFYWGKISPDTDCRQVRFHIKNNTNDTIKLNRIGGGDGAFIYNWERDYNIKSNPRIIAPGGIIKVRVLQNRIYYPGPVSRSLGISYIRNNQDNHTTILSWGIIQPAAQQIKKNETDPEIVKLPPTEKKQTPTAYPKTLKPDKTEVPDPPRKSIKPKESLTIELTVADTSLSKSLIALDCWIGEDLIKPEIQWKNQTMTFKLMVQYGDQIYLHLKTKRFGVFYKTMFTYQARKDLFSDTVPAISLFSKGDYYTFNIKGRDSVYHSNYYRINGDISFETLNRYLKKYYNTTAFERHDAYYVYINHPPNALRMERFFKSFVKNFGIYPVRERPGDKKGRVWYSNVFIAEFYNLSESEVEQLLKECSVKLKSTGTVGSQPVYILSFDYLLDPQNIASLEKLYARKEVKYVSQTAGRVMVLD